MFRKRTFCAVDGEVGGGEAWNRDFRMEFYTMELIFIRVWATNWKNHGIEFTNYNEGNLGRVPTTLCVCEKIGGEKGRGRKEGNDRAFGKLADENESSIGRALHCSWQLVGSSRRGRRISLRWKGTSRGREGTERGEGGRGRKEKKQKRKNSRGRKRSCFDRRTGGEGAKKEGGGRGKNNVQSIERLVSNLVKKNYFPPRLIVDQKILFFLIEDRGLASRRNYPFEYATLPRRFDCYN